MSITTRSSDKIHKYASHWRNNSGEIAVFEADQYFSRANENQGTFRKLIIDENKKYHPTARMSLDMPMRISPIYPHNNNHHHHRILDEKQMMNKEHKKLYKQPSSPGGRLASFLNSLFNQNNSKKKKSKKIENPKDIIDQEESPCGRRKRRISISHFRITGFNDHSKKSMHDSKNSGFRTPPVYANTPTKSCRDFRSFLDQQKGKNGGDIRVCSNGNNILEKCELSEERKLYRKFIDEDDEDEDSDSSSDLFDLPINHELDFYSSGLPVYETTHVDRISIGAAV